MNPKRVNWLFLAAILYESIFIVGYSLVNYYYNIQLDVINSLLVSQSFMLIPIIIFLFIWEPKFWNFVPIKPLKILTSILIFLITLLCVPPIMAINAFSMIFVENAAYELSNELLGLPIWVSILVVGIIGPVLEEFAFRGVFFHGYKRSGRVVASALLSAFLFGLMHLNFNQMSYAFFVGIVCAFLVDVTGSLLAPIIFHCTINTGSVILSLLNGTNTNISQEQVQAEFEKMAGMNYEKGLLITAVTMLGISIFSMAIASGVFFLIIQIEGKTQYFQQIKEKALISKNAKLVSIPLVIAVVLCFIYMTASLALSNMT